MGSGEEEAVLTGRMLERVESYSWRFAQLMEVNGSSYEELREQLYGNFGGRTSKAYVDDLVGEVAAAAAAAVPAAVPAAGLSEERRRQSRTLSAIALLALQELGPFGIFVSETLPLLWPEHFSRDVPGRR